MFGDYERSMKKLALLRQAVDPGNSFTDLRRETSLDRRRPRGNARPSGWPGPTTDVGRLEDDRVNERRHPRAEGAIGHDGNQGDRYEHHAVLDHGLALFGSDLKLGLLTRAAPTHRRPPPSEGPAPFP